MNTHPSFTAFAGGHYIASGSLRAIAPAIKDVIERDPDSQILVFDDASGNQTNMDLRGSLEEVLDRLPLVAELNTSPSGDTTPVPAPVPVAPGRPRLGVVAREVTLLPRHWDWLASQPGGASVALRKLVEHAQRDNRAVDQQREARDATYKFITALAGNLAGFEEATRALFAGQRAAFEACLAAWPHDVREHAKKMAAPSFSE